MFACLTVTLSTAYVVVTAFLFECESCGHLLFLFSIKLGNSLGGYLLGGCMLQVPGFFLVFFMTAFTDGTKMLISITGNEVSFVMR